LSTPTSARFPTSSALSIPTSVEFSFLPEGTSSYLLAVDQPGSEGFTNLSGPVSFDPVYASALAGVALPVISSPCSAFSGSTAISLVSGPFGYAHLDSKGLSEGFSSTSKFSEVWSNFRGGVSPPPDSQKEVMLASPVDTMVFSTQTLALVRRDGLRLEVVAPPPADVSAPFGGSILDSKGFEFSSLGAAALGERIRFTLLVMLESGAPHLPVRVQIGHEISPEIEKKTTQMDVSLFDEAMTAISAPTTPCLGASSQALGGIVVRSSLKPGGGVGNSPPSSFLR